MAGHDVRSAFPERFATSLPKIRRYPTSITASLYAPQDVPSINHQLCTINQQKFRDEKSDIFVFAESGWRVV
jgi:hypothetical protein